LKFQIEGSHTPPTHLVLDGLHLGAYELSDSGHVHRPALACGRVGGQAELDGVPLLEKVTLVCQAGDAVWVRLLVCVIWFRKEKQTGCKITE